MRVILLMDVDDVGVRGDRIDVAAGFARNYLIPRRLAVPETAGNLRVMEEEGKLSDVRDRKARREADKVRAFLGEHELFTTLRIGREGKAFGAITTKDIAILLRQTGLEVDRRRIRLDAPIKRLGRFDVPLALHPDVETSITVFVDRQGGSKEGAITEQRVHEERLRAAEEVAKAEAEARAQREKEAEEAARVAIEKAQARKAREEEEARAREEARRGKVLEDPGAAPEETEGETGSDAQEANEVSEEAAPEKA